MPLYHQIFLGLRDQIVSGSVPSGAVLPTEHELAADYGVSRITARRALDELAQHGLVERRRRTGTRVTFEAPAAPIEANLEQAVESLLAFGRNTGVRVVELVEQPASDAVATALALAPGAAVTRAVRIRTLDGEPLGQVVSHVSVALGLAVTRERLTDTPMLALLREAGLTIGGGRQTISALAADPALAAALEIEPRTPLLRIDRVVSDGGGQPLLATVAHYRADRYRLTVDLQGAAAGVSRER